MARYDHYWKGIRVVNVDVLGVLGPDDRAERVSYSYRSVLEPPSGLETPGVSMAEASRVAENVIQWGPGDSKALSHELVLEPIVERVLVATPSPWAQGVGDPSRTSLKLKGWRLVHTFTGRVPGKSGVAKIRVDAHRGVLLSADGMSSGAPMSLTGRSEYNRIGGSVEVPFMGTQVGGGYFLAREGLYGIHMGDVLYPLYLKGSPFFGDGNPYVPGADWASPNGETQAVDAMIGLNKSYDFYQRVYGRDHIDGSNGYFVDVAVHQDALGAPALAWWEKNWGHERYWVDFRSWQDYVHPGSPTELSVVAHEWTHLVNYRTARVGKDGAAGSSFNEQDTVEEAVCTIMGTAARFWDSTGQAYGIGYPDPARWKYDWTYQPQVAGMEPYSQVVDGTSCLFRPRLLQGMPAWYTWSNEGVGDDRYRAGAPLLRAYYFMVNGAQPIRDKDDLSDEQRGRTTPFLPWGFEGLGAHNASLVFYQALTQTMNSSTDRITAAWQLHQAAEQVFGTGSANAQVVRNALAAVNLMQPPMYSLPVGSSSSSPLSAPVVPAGVHLAQFPYATLQASEEAHYIRTTIPPFSTAVMYLYAGVGLPVEVLSMDGSAVPTTADVWPPFIPHCDQTPTLDPELWPEDPYECQPQGPWTTYVESTNPSNQPKEVLLKISRPPGLQEELGYSGQVAFSFTGVRNPGLVTSW